MFPKMHCFYTSESTAAPVISPVTGLDGTWRRCSMTFWKLDSLVPISAKAFIFFATQLYRPLGDLKWSHTHGWLYWWFTFTAKRLSSGGLRPLISLQQATNCEVMYWSLQSVAYWEHCFNVLMPSVQKALFRDTLDIGIYFFLFQTVDLVLAWVFGTHHV